MLKIKGDIDLKELEKFLFEEDEENYFYYGFTRADDRSEIRYYVDKKSRIISIGFDVYVSPYHIGDKLFELFEADLVEKVDD